MGANIGYYALLAARLVGEEGKVFAFEPDPNNFKILKKNIIINKYNNIIPVNKAVSDKTGKVKLYLSRENKGSHTIYDFGDKRDFIEVDTISLNEYFKEYNKKIDFIIMDIEGSEFEAYKGMRKLLEKYKNIKILTEFWYDAIKKTNSNPIEFLKFISKDGFKINYMDEDLKKLIETNENGVLEKLKTHKRDALNLFLIKN